MRYALEPDDFGGWVTQLGDPLRARHAYWHLVLSGSAALRAVRVGLHSPNADIRDYCTRALDHLVDLDAFPELIAMLEDADHRVRLDALHAFTCDRCKDNECRPNKEAVLSGAIALLRGDPHKHVRAMAAEVVGRWVHSDAEAADALVTCRDNDPDPSVRKKASWYAPDGTIYRKTAPRRKRVPDLRQTSPGPDTQNG